MTSSTTDFRSFLPPAALGEPEPTTAARPASALTDLRQLLAVRPSIAPELLVTIPIFLYPSVGGMADIGAITTAIVACWLATAGGRIAVQDGPGAGSKALIVGAVLASLGVLAGKMLGSGVPMLLALLVALEATRASARGGSLTIEVALLAATTVIRLDIGMTTLGIDHGPAPILLLILLTAFEALTRHRAERSEIVLTHVGVSTAPGLAALDLLLTAVAAVATAVFVVVLTEEPLIRGLAGGAPLLGLPGFVLGLAGRLAAVWRKDRDAQLDPLQDRWAMAGLVATALGLTIGGELLGG